MKSSEIRQRFLQAFEAQGHTPVRSSSLVPANDPTLFFTNAGMVQFKDVFTGAEKRPYSRATSVQKCLRVSGKHNDLENVGRTPRHHTFFEMLGNFSFGDYFKKEAIPFAWELLTGEFGLDPDRLWVSVFEEDDEAYTIWRDDVGFPEARLQRMDAKENFWSMGPTGPCGPCSEIHWDHGPSISDDTRGPAGEDPRYVEIWNLVFMQFDQQEDGSRIDLPRPSIDTGAGLERIAAILQGVTSNYETDCFQPLIARTSELAGLAYGAANDSDVAMRVISDHARATAFLVADGVMPSNEERGYVLRRIMRRGIRYGVNIGLDKPFLSEIVACVADQMGEAYPELRERQEFTKEVVLAEEERFSETLEKGLQLLEGEFEKLGEGQALPGEVVFKLYDTYGFPTDLTRLIADERKIQLDEAGYEAAMEVQRAAGRAAWKGSGEQGLASIAVPEGCEATGFSGYDGPTDESTILAIQGDDGPAATLQAGDKGILVVETTPFYAESGGQVGDCGHIRGADACFRVDDTQKGQGDLVLHLGEMVEGSLAPGDSVTLEVNDTLRARTRLNHTATHLLHSALKTVLGDHVAQKGSLVEPNRLRFDFSHHKSVTGEELAKVEDLVYSEILSNQAVTTELKSLEDAREAGAEALFGEKYAEEVRVVSVGAFSMELCGGTHAAASGDIGLFRIISEGGIAAGVRRVEAVTGLGALDFIRQRDDLTRLTAERLRTPVEQLPQAIDRLVEDRKRLEKELEGARRELARAASGNLSDEAREINGIPVVSAEVPGNANTLREEADRIRSQLGSVLVVLGSREGGRVVLVAAATPDLVAKGIHAGQLVKAVAEQVGGGGGGRPDMAQAGGSQPDALPDALASVYALVEAATA